MAEVSKTSLTDDFNQAALEASIRLEEAKLSLVESMYLNKNGVADTAGLQKLIDSGKLAIAQAWRLVKLLDESYKSMSVSDIPDPMQALTPARGG